MSGFWTGGSHKAPRRGLLRRKREQWPLPGMVLLHDGSKRARLPAGRDLDLIVTMDGATSEHKKPGHFSAEIKANITDFEEAIPKVVDVLLAQQGKPGLRYLDHAGHSVPW